MEGVNGEGKGVAANCSGEAYSCKYSWRMNTEYKMLAESWTREAGG